MTRSRDWFYRSSILEVTESVATEWLPRTGNQSWCGFDPGGWSSSCWVLHAMYETDTLPGGLTHNDVRRIEEAALPPAQESEHAERIRKLLGSAVTAGSPLGKSERPNDSWRRLRWSELALRLTVDPFADGRLPSFSSFSLDSWPVCIRPPAEGALDREQYRRLLELLAGHASDGFNTDCTIRYGACWDMHRAHAYRGTLQEAVDEYDDPVQHGVPNNIWPADRAWFIYTDYDLCGTKISGNEELVTAIRRDTELETHQHQL